MAKATIPTLSPFFRDGDDDGKKKSIEMGNKATIPIVNLSPFFRDGDDDGKKKVKQMLSHACSEYGAFQLVNHGIPLHLMNRAMDLSKTFFEYPTQEKRKSAAKPGAPQPSGYGTQSPNSSDKNEYLSMFSPGSRFNVFPTNPPEFREVLEALFPHFINIGGLVVENIINDCLGLPPNFLEEYNHDRSVDFLQALHYFPALESSENSGKSEHEDGSCVTFVYQDEVGGLEFYHDGQWILVPPVEGALVVNIGDIIQVLSNNKFKSATHRVVSPKGRSRYSYVFFYNLDGEKWVEPLPQFTTEIGEPPKYRGFLNKEYVKLRVLDRINPPSRPEDRFCIKHYAIST